MAEKDEIEQAEPMNERKARFEAYDDGFKAGLEEARVRAVYAISPRSFEEPIGARVERIERATPRPIPAVELGDRSPAIGKLMLALAKAQGEMRAAPRDANNPYHRSKYADLASIVDSARAPLAKHEIAWSQWFEQDPDSPDWIVIVMVLAHAEEWLIGRLRIRSLPKEKGQGGASIDPRHINAQDIVAATTYGRRVLFAAMVGAVAEGEDDDGNRASGRDEDRRQEARPRSQERRPPRGTEPKQAGHAEPAKAPEPLVAAISQVAQREAADKAAAEKKLLAARERIVALMRELNYPMTRNQVTKAITLDLPEAIARAAGLPGPKVDLAFLTTARTAALEAHLIAKKAEAGSGGSPSAPSAPSQAPQRQATRSGAQGPTATPVVPASATPPSPTLPLDDDVPF